MLKKCITMFYICMYFVLYYLRRWSMTTTITTRVNSDDKALFDAFCESVGLTASSAINMFIKATIREGEIPFKIKADPFFSESNQALLKKNKEEMEKTGGTIHDIDLDV